MQFRQDCKDKGGLMPVSDELMFYDFEEHRYVLTPKDILDRFGINLAVRLNKRGANNIENVAKNFLDLISLDVYDFIFTYNINNKTQEWLIAKTKTGRNLIKKAMEQQVLYVMNNGDLNNYSGVDVRNGRVMEDFSARAIAPLAKQILAKLIPEIGRSVLYSGFIGGCPNYEEGGF